VGTFFHPITLATDTGSETVEALADTGSTFTTLPSALLERLGVQPHRTIRLRLADGRVQERPVGRVHAQLNGVDDEILCVFGTEDSVPTIGAHTLETFLLGVDPDRHRLVPVEGWWA